MCRPIGQSRGRAEIPAVPSKRNSVSLGVSLHTSANCICCHTCQLYLRPPGIYSKEFLRWRRLSSLRGKDEGTAGLHMPSYRPAAFVLSETRTALTSVQVLCQGRFRKGKGKRQVPSGIPQSSRPRILQGPSLLSPTLAQVNIVKPSSDRAAVSSRHVDGGCSALEANRHTPCQFMWLFSGRLLPHKFAVTLVHAYTRHG